MKVIKKISNLFSWILVFFILAMAGILIASTFNTPIGVRIFSVLSGSMEPNLHVGSLIITKAQDNYSVDDIVTVRSERSAKETVTHRIVEIQEDPESKAISYVLKGDANEEADREPVAKSRVLGKVISHLPRVGYVLGSLQSPIGFVVLIVIPATIIVYSEVMSIKKELLRMFKSRSTRSRQGGNGARQEDEAAESDDEE